MSFLTEFIVRGAATLPRAAVAVHAPRVFTTSLARQKTPVDSVKDGIKTVDRAVSDKLVDGIDVAAKAGSKIKNSDAAAKAQELKGEASGKASELKGEAKGAAAQAKGTAKGAAEQAKQKL